MNDLEKFITAQEKNYYNYDNALLEIKAGRKKTHWIWYIFPQLKGLGRSYNAEYYGIENLDEAKNYLANPILGERLFEITQELLNLSKNDPVYVMGSEIDAMKLKSSMTLFAFASEKKDSIFHKVLEKFFGGEMDENTLNLINIKKSRNAFTLIELFLVVLVIAILAGTIMVSGEESIISAEANNIINNMRILKTAALDWIADHGDFIDPSSYTVTYPWSYLDVRDRRNVGGIGIPGTIANMRRDIEPDSEWRANFLTYVEPNTYKKSITQDGKIEFHSNTEGQGKSYAVEEGYAIVDNNLAGNKNSTLKNHSRWYVVYRPKSSGNHAKKLKEKLAAKAEEFGLFKNAVEHYTKDASYVYMEIIDFAQK